MNLEGVKKTYLKDNYRNNFDYDKMTTLEDCKKVARDMGLLIRKEDIDYEFIAENIDAVILCLSNKTGFDIDIIG